MEGALSVREIAMEVSGTVPQYQWAGEALPSYERCCFLVERVPLWDATVAWFRDQIHNPKTIVSQPKGNPQKYTASWVEQIHRSPSFPLDAFAPMPLLLSALELDGDLRRIGADRRVARRHSLLFRDRRLRP